jgi:drug/metabolite transporter (DMT)-like permease
MVYIDRNRKYGTRFAGFWGEIFTRIPSTRINLLLAANGACLTLQQISFIAGLSFTTPTLTSLFGPAAIITTSFVSIMIKNEGKSPIKIVGIVVSVVSTFGTLLASILSKGESGFSVSMDNLIGGSLLTVGTLFSAIYNNLQTYIMNKHDVPPITVSAYSCGYSGVLTTLVSLFFFNKCDFAGSTWQVWYGLVFAATFGAAIPWTIGTFTCKYLKPTMVVVHSCTLPLWTAVLSYFLLGTVISVYTGIGAVAIVTGVLIVAVAKWKESNAKPVPIEELTIVDASVESSTSPVAGDLTEMQDIELEKPVGLPIIAEENREEV